MLTCKKADVLFLLGVPALVDQWWECKEWHACLPRYGVFGTGYSGCWTCNLLRAAFRCACCWNWYRTGGLVLGGWIIPGLVSRIIPTYKPWNGHLEGVPQPYWGGLLIMVINHLLTGMILQVVAWLDGGFQSIGDFVDPSYHAASFKGCQWQTPRDGKLTPFSKQFTLFELWKRSTHDQHLWKI